MALGEALARCPRLTLVPGDPIAVAQAWDGAARALEMARPPRRRGLRATPPIGQHPGGMVISTRPLIDCVPIVPAAMPERQMVQWDKDGCSDGGFLKIDILGLGMLSAVERCVELISARTGERVDLSRIPFNDPKTFQAIQKADTTGVFQIESRAQMGSLRRTLPANLPDLTIQVALVRPGPIVGGAVNTYIERRQAILRDPSYEVPFLHPALRECLAEDARHDRLPGPGDRSLPSLRGLHRGAGREPRRAMSRKRSAEAMNSHREQFLQGAARRHPDAGDEVTARVWNMVAGFAGFGFPKSHGAAFGLLAYQSTWLRVHHPSEFLCALLSEQPMGFYPPDALIHEAQHREVVILPPDVLCSEAECTLTQDGEIRVGLNHVKGVHAEDIERLVASRHAGGNFDNLADFAARAGVSTPTLERLAWSGACDGLAGGESSRSAHRAVATRRRTTRRENQGWPAARAGAAATRGARPTGTHRAAGDDRRLSDGRHLNRPPPPRTPTRPADGRRLSLHS